MNPDKNETPSESSAETVDGAMFLENCTGIDCPRCPGTLKIASIAKNKIAGCSDCHGLLLQSHQMNSIVHEGRANYQGTEAKPQMIDQHQLHTGCECPACGLKMETHPYGGGPGNVVIDSCIHCHLIWLDSAELKRLIEAEGIRDLPSNWEAGFDAESIDSPN